MATFKKRPISAQELEGAVKAASASSLLHDPRLQGHPTQAAEHAAAPNLASSQDQTPGIDTIVNVPLTKIKSNPFNPRAIYTSAAVDDMAESLKAHGQKVAALAFFDGTHFVLIEGETRLRAARTAGLETLRIEVRPRPQSDQHLYEEARAANVDRRDQTALDDAIRWRELLDKRVYPTQVALANALKIEQSIVSRTLSLAALPPKVVTTLSDYPNLLNLKMLNAIREYSDKAGEHATLDLIHDIVKHEMGFREVAARKAALDKAPVRRPRSTPTQVQFKGAKGEIKSFDDDGRIELVIKGLADEDRRLLHETLKNVFENHAHQPQT